MRQRTRLETMRLAKDTVMKAIVDALWRDPADLSKLVPFTVTSEMVSIDRDLHVAGKITAEKNIIAHFAVAYAPEIFANLVTQAPLHKPTSSSVGIKTNAAQFEVNANNELQIKAGVLAPMAHIHAMADVTGLVDALAAMAQINSPAFTGSPTVSTPDALDNSTRIANTAFVRSVVAGLVDSSPASLDTLNELAAALGNDPNFATTVLNSLAGKAPINSPVFTGTVQGITKSMVGLANVDNTSDANKPISTAMATALGLKVDKVAGKSLVNDTDIAKLAAFAVESGKVTIDRDLHVSGMITAEKNIIAHFAGAYAPQIFANLVTQAPLYKPTSSSIVLAYNINQFEVNSYQELQIKAGVLAPAAHSHAIVDVTGLQAALDGKLPYRTFGTAANNNVGDFGRYINQTFIGYYDANDLTQDYGTYTRTGYQWYNTPENSIGVLKTDVYSSDWISQEYTAIGGGAKYWRKRHLGSTWDDWRRIWDSGNFNPDTKANTGHIHYKIEANDNRSVPDVPNTYITPSLSIDFKNNSANGLYDGGSFNGVITFRKYGSGADWSGGGANQLGFSENGNMWLRLGSADYWGQWVKLYHSGNLTNTLSSNSLSKWNGSQFVNSGLSSDASMAVDLNYNNGATGGFYNWGGSTTPKFISYANGDGYFAGSITASGVRSSKISLDSFYDVDEKGSVWYGLTNRGSSGIDFNGYYGINFQSANVFDFLKRAEGKIASFRPHSDVVTSNGSSYITVGYSPIVIGSNYNSGNPYGFIEMLNDVRAMQVYRNGMVQFNSDINLLGVINGFSLYSFNYYTKGIKASGYDFKIISGDDNHSVTLSYAGGLYYDGNTIWHGGNSNRSDVDWTARDIYASLIVSRSIGESFRAIGSDGEPRSLRLGNSVGSFYVGVDDQFGSFFGTAPYNSVLYSPVNNLFIKTPLARFSDKVSAKSYELKDASGNTIWTVELSGTDLLFKNQSGVKEMKLEQGGRLLCANNIVAHSTQI